MSAFTVIVVALGGGLGSALRDLADNALPARLRAHFPWGTVLVNLTGSLLLGIVAGAASNGLPSFWTDVIGSGIVGGYTTFSTASIETVRLALERRKWAAMFNSLGILTACVALALLGYVAVSA